MDQEPESTPVDEQEFPTDAKPWLDLLTEAKKSFEYYHEKCDNVDKYYAHLKERASDANCRELQIFWANIEVLKPAIYARPPVPVVVPRFKDQKELPRHASEMLERTLNTSFDLNDIDQPLRHIRDDLAVNARGALWLRYEAIETDTGIDEKVIIEHIDRKDFRHEPARKWAEVGWVARRAWMTKKEGERRFQDNFKGAEFKSNKANNLTDENDETYTGDKRAEVWEIWHKADNRVVWVSPGMEEVLDIQEPYLTLDGFFPCPRPVYGTVQRGTLIPVPDYLQYKDQIEEVNELTERISGLAEALKLRGFAPGGESEIIDAIEKAMTDADSRAMIIPVSNFAALGGSSLKDSIVWLPLAEVAATVKELILLRRQIIEDIYEVSGLSDILRGATDPNETLGAQQLKAQTGSNRIRDRQAEIVRISRDVSRMAGEIMAENFQPETFVAMSQVDVPREADIQQQMQQLQAQAAQIAGSEQGQQLAQQNPQAAQQAVQAFQQQMQALSETITVEKIVQMLRDERMRPFILEIETDSTIQPDEDAEKQRRTEFLTAVGGFISQAGPMVLQMPQTGPFVAEALKFTAAGFRAGRELEGVIEDFAEQISQFGQQQPQQGPSPEQQKAEQAAKAQEAEILREKTRVEIDKILAEIERIKAQTVQASQPEPADV